MTESHGPGWQLRQNGRWYFYRRVRMPDGTSLRKCFGSGERAHREAAKAATARSHREAYALEEAETRADCELAKQFSVAVHDMATAELLLAGFHNPNGRGWRLANMKDQARNKRSKIRSSETTEPAANLEDAPDTSFQRTIQEIIQSVKDGDQSSIPDLRQAIQENADYFAVMGDLGNQLILHWINRISKTNHYQKECLRHKVHEMQQKFLNGSNSQTELLLVQEIAATWLEHHHWKLQDLLDETSNLQLRNVRSKRIDDSSNRYLVALKTFEQHRLLMQRQQRATTPSQKTPAGRRKTDTALSSVSQNRVGGFFDADAMN